MPYLDRTTCRIHYLHAGRGEPALVFVHGWCDNAGVWGPLIERLAGRYRCLAPDLRGHGKSSRPSDHAYFYEALAGDVMTLCTETGIERPVLIGHSLGGGLAAEMVARFTDYARGLVVLDQPLGLVEERTPEAIRFIRSPETHAQFRESLKLSLFPPDTPDHVVEQVLDNMDETPIDVSLAVWAWFFEATTEEWRERELRARRAFGLVPSLNIDSRLLLDYHATLKKESPNVELEVFAGSHWIHLEHPDLLAERLGEFLSNLPA